MEEFFGKLLGVGLVAILLYFAVVWFVTHVLPWLVLGALVVWLVWLAVTVGQGALEVQTPPPPSASVVRPLAAARPVAASRTPAAVRRGEAVAVPYWTKRGWVRENGHLVGDYQVAGLRVPGRVDLSGRDVRIWRPPEVLKRHPHWGCFFYVGNGWRKLHFVTPPRDPDTAIMHVERMIQEAMRGGPGR